MPMEITIVPAESRMSFRGSPAYRAAASRSAEISANTRMRTAAVRPIAVISRRQSNFGPASRRARMKAAAIATASTDSEDHIGGEGFSPSGFGCLASPKFIGLPRSCIFTPYPSRFPCASRSDTWCNFFAARQVTLATCERGADGTPPWPLFVSHCLSEHTSPLPRLSQGARAVFVEGRHERNKTYLAPSHKMGWFSSVCY